jgi:hypothetical protein
MLDICGLPSLLTPSQATCGAAQSCSNNGCNGAFNSAGNPVCMGNFYGCPCIPNPIWIPPPPTQSRTVQPSQPTPPPLEDPWFVVGLYEEDDCNFASCLHAYGFGAMNMNAGTLEETDLNGVGPSYDLCNAIINGAKVDCYGDITTNCAPYGIALYNSRTCRTYCPSLGDSQFAWDLFDGDFGATLSTVLVCDRALS